MVRVLERSEQKAPIRALIANAADMVSMFSDIERLRNKDFAKVWHPFPTTAQELQAALTAIGAEPDVNNEFFISGYQSEIGDLRGYLPEFANLNELNYLASKINDMTDEQRELYSAVIVAGRYCGSMAQMIDLTENLDLFGLYPAHTLKEYTEFIKTLSQDEQADGIEKLKESNDPDMHGLAEYIERLEKHVDYREYTREVVKLEKGTFTDYGYLTESEGFRQVHDVVPQQYRVVTPATPTPEQRPSALGRLAAAKEDVAKDDAKRQAPGKSANASHDDTEL